MRTVTLDEVKESIDRGDVIVAEALPPSYFEDDHLPGAVNLPHDHVDELAVELLPDRDAHVVVYCSGPDCANSKIAARRLDDLGYGNVAVYEGGKRDWTSAGLRLEAGSGTAVAR